tara:strand:- start:31654 stop:33450 length:1797 start_codon:yes stop_codon:yes gene_type:complete
MCGFLGSITFKPIEREIFEVCNKRIECRGPDKKTIQSNKIFQSNKLFHNFAFNRLSIIDLSESANQPMYSDEFNSLVMFNGEVFNHRQLRKKLEKNTKFKTSHSDTEALLNGLSFEGINFLKQLNGQFSIFYFDINKKEYYLARDRAGQKPLYYTVNNNGFYFGSDLTAVKNLSGNNHFDDNQIANYLNLGSTITPNSFFKNIYCVEPGEYIKIKVNNENFELENRKYWEIHDYLDDKTFSEEEFVDLFEDSVDIRLDSDVPVSVFLSGGLDSTSIVKAISKKRESINSFSLITNSKKYNESEYMNSVVNKYKTNHHIELVESEIPFDKIQSILLSYDDIIYDPSIIPTFILSNKISKNFKVAISGDGGDELLSGYSHYNNFHNNRKFADSLIKKIYKYYPENFGTGNKILKYSNNWKTSYTSFYSDVKLMKLLNIDNYESFESIYLNGLGEDWKSLTITDYKYFLNELMLKKIDKSSMLNSLEIRSPFLDYRLYEYILGHRRFDTQNDFTPKKIIKNYLLGDFDKQFLERQKMGFSINLNNIVYNNINTINDQITSSILNNFIDLSKVKNLLKVKSRINAIRIWKLYSLSMYLESNK